VDTSHCGAQKGHATARLWWGQTLRAPVKNQSLELGLKDHKEHSFLFGWGLHVVVGAQSPSSAFVCDNNKSRY
jgi:hypothetical protein